MLRKTLHLLFVGTLLLTLLSLNLSPALSAPRESPNHYPAWEPWRPYAVGDLVTYNGRDYRCITAHTSQPDWTPNVTPALWQDLGPTGGATATPTRTSTATATAPPNTSTPTRTGTVPPTATPTRTQSPGGDGSPFGGTPWTVPGTIQAENFNTGGQGVAYNDADTTNNGGQYRTSEAVDIQTTADTGGGFNVGWTRAGEWLKYTVNVTASGAYTFSARAAANGGGAVFHLEVDGANVTGPLSLPSTGGWQAWTTVSRSGLNLAAGQHVLRVVFDTPISGGTAVGNYNYFTLSGGGVTATATPTRTATGTSVTPTPTLTRTVTRTPTVTPTSGNNTCPVQSAPSGKVLVGYWETWDGSGVHPGMGHIPLSQSHSNYNVINVAFPVILSDGTMVFEDGMAPGEDVPTPAEVCAEKTRGRRILLSIGGAAAGIDLNSTAVADRFIQTAVPILKQYNFDGIDIDIETGLVAGPNFSTLSTSQSNLIRIIDGILAQMPSNFMLTMAPETAYVTGGQIAYGGPWGAYLPIIKKYLDNGRLSWLQMQYYNGSMYGCNPPGAAYQAGTVEGFVEQTRCMANGFQVAGGGPTIQIPYSKLVPGLPAQPGAGGGYMSPSLVSQAYSQVSSIKGLMTWSINWDGSKGWTFATTKPF